MGKVTFGMMTSLDGDINDRQGGFDWGQVSEDVHRFAEAEQKREGLAIYGRRMYETMVYWETADQDERLDCLGELRPERPPSTAAGQLPLRIVAAAQAPAAHRGKAHLEGDVLTFTRAQMDKSFPS